LRPHRIVRDWRRLFEGEIVPPAGPLKVVMRWKRPLTVGITWLLAVATLAGSAFIALGTTVYFEDELPPFLLGIWLFTAWWGITGTALAWTARMLIDFGALRWLSRPRGDQPGRRSGDRIAAVVGGFTLAAFAVSALVPGNPGRGLALTLGAIAWVIAALRLRAEWPVMTSIRRVDGVPR
jgi:hypothetical protein